MAEAQAYITVTDESMGSVTTSSAIPLLIIATQANKLVGDSKVVTYPGTSEPLTLRLISGQQDLIDKYGNPYFEINNGTVNQASELNELGLWTAYSYLGVSSLCYVLRADIDTAQLTFADAEPTSPAANGTYWFDTMSSSFGVFRSNGNSNKAKAWDKVDTLIPTSSDVSGSTPKSTYGSLGNIAIVTVNEDGENNVNNPLFEKVDGSTWLEIGTADWYKAHPTIISGKTLDGSFAGATTAGEIIIQKAYDTRDVQLITINVVAGDTLDTLVEKINSFSFNGYVVEAENVNNALVIRQVDAQDMVIYAMADGAVSDAVLTQFGLNPTVLISETTGHMVVAEGVKAFYSDHIHYPSGPVGSIWIKTTKANYGSEWVIKRYNATNVEWTQVPAELYSSELNAEVAYGNALVGGSLFVKVPEVSAEDYSLGNNPAEAQIMQLTDGNGFTTEDLTIDTEKATTINITTVRNAAIVNRSANIAVGATYQQIANAINNMNIEGLVASAKETSFKIISDYPYTLVYETVVDNVSTKTVYTKWQQLTNYVASPTEPVSEALDTTLWISNDFKADILVNDGDEWRGLGDNRVYITSADPLFENSLNDGDIWLDSSDLENYPMLRRWDASGNTWETIDLTDQSSPSGIIFADARENAGPAYPNSTHVPFSTDEADLRASQYVDPDAPDPRSYPAGLLLFNTRLSTNNVKMFIREYFNDITDATFTVGNSPEFPAPGTSTNPKISRWINASGNDLDGSPYMGRKAQRIMIVRALASAITSSQAIRADDVDFGIIACPGYVEVYDELVTLNTDRKEKSYLVIDTPARLKPDATEITNWVNNANNAASNGDEGLTTRYTYSCMTYPWGLGTSLEGYEVMIPSSAMKLRTIAYSDSIGGVYKPAAGKIRGVVSNAASVGYLNDEGEYEPVKLLEGVRNVLFDLGINPIYNRKNGGLVVWGDKTMQSYESALDQEHVARTVCKIRTDLDKLCEPYFFEINDADLRKQFGNAVTAYLSGIMAQKGLEDFAVVCDDSNNTQERKNRKELWCDVALLFYNSVRFIYIPIRVVNDASQL